MGAALTPAKGKRPTASAWALEAHDVGPDGEMTERLRASGAIATAATHPAQGQVKMAKRHTWQVAMQVAAGKALCYAEQLRRKGRRVTISLPSAITGIGGPPYDASRRHMTAVSYDGPEVSYDGGVI